jgi:hypothetical protein
MELYLHSPMRLHGVDGHSFTLLAMLYVSYCGPVSLIRTWVPRGGGETLHLLTKVHPRYNGLKGGGGGRYRRRPL